MSDFGDIELADVWDIEPTIAPEQVAMRLHVLRRAVEQLAGHDLEPFEDLSVRDRDHALRLGSIIADWVVVHEPDNPARLAEFLHDILVPDVAWNGLSGEERQIGIDLMRPILSWLDLEGPR